MLVQWFLQTWTTCWLSVTTWEAQNFSQNCKSMNLIHCHIHLKPFPLLSLLSFFFFLNLARKATRRCSKFHTKCCNVSLCIASCVTCKTPINCRAKKSLQAQVWLYYFSLYSSFVWFHLLILFTVENGIIWCLIIFKHVTFFSSLLSEVHGTDNIIGDRAKVHFPLLQKYPG